MARSTISVDVDVSIEEFDTDALIEELKARKEELPVREQEPAELLETLKGYGVPPHLLREVADYVLRPQPDLLALKRWQEWCGVAVNGSSRD